MCYGSGCSFEDSQGDCRCYLWGFRERYGYSPCVVGGSSLEISEEEYQKNKVVLENIYQKYKNDMEAERNRLFN